MWTASEDPNDRPGRDYLDDLLDNAPASLIPKLVPILERMLRALGCSFAVREEKEPEAPRAYRKIMIPADRHYVGLGCGGDILHCKLIIRHLWSLPKTNASAEKRGFVGKWLVFFHAKLEDARIMRTTKFCRSDVEGESFSLNGAFQRDCFIKHRDMHPDMGIYEVMEVIPGSDWDWLRDTKFVEVLRRCGWNTEEAVA